MVTALSSSSGSTKWTFTAGGAVNVTPMINADGSVYVGSANGTLYALAESTGVQRWSHSIGSPITASPADYPLTHLVFVGASNGTLTALSSTSGKVQSILRDGSPIVGIATVLKVSISSLAQTGNSRLPAIMGQRERASIHRTFTTTPPVVVDGAAYVGNSNGDFEPPSLRTEPHRSRK